MTRDEKIAIARKSAEPTFTLAQLAAHVEKIAAMIGSLTPVRALGTNEDLLVRHVVLSIIRNTSMGRQSNERDVM